MTLNSQNTYADAIAAYQDNACYEELADVTRCRAFISACRFLLSFPASASAGDGQSITIDLARVQAELTQARVWLTDNNPAAGNTGSRTFSFRDFRGPGGGW